ncbi:SDR family oxidoreductase [Pelagibacteraceae bacterium]|nr:SDR family oxidoreductase [Pelagibacteraceae bacterium]
MQNKTYFNLHNKTIIITGAGGLLGTEHCVSVGRNGANVIAIDKSKKKLKLLEKILVKEKINFKSFILDIQNIKEIKNIKKKIIKDYKKIDVLINNAAIDYKPHKSKKKNNLQKINFKNLKKEFDVGLFGMLYCCQVFGSEMIKKKYGSIINIASDLSVIAPDQRLYNHLNIEKPISYSIIKHGVVGLTKYLASYWGSKKIRVNCLSPGGIFDNQDMHFTKKIKKLIPLNRMANKQDYHGAIIFLCSDESSYMTGHNWIIDGGRSII